MPLRTNGFAWQRALKFPSTLESVPHSAAREIQILIVSLTLMTKAVVRSRRLLCRKFDWKDHLIQHLPISHGIKATPELPAGLNEWNKHMHDAEAVPLWRCGFLQHP